MDKPRAEFAGRFARPPGPRLLKLLDPEQEELVHPFPEWCDFVPQPAPDFLLPRGQVNSPNFRNFGWHGHLLPTAHTHLFQRQSPYQTVRNRIWLDVEMKQLARMGQMPLSRIGNRGQRTTNNVYEIRHPGTGIVGLKIATRSRFGEPPGRSPKLNRASPVLYNGQRAFG